jgi:cytochrome P450
MTMDSAIQMVPRISNNRNAGERDIHIPRGNSVYLLTGAANQDPAIIEQADIFICSKSPKMQFGFGYGLHVCLGMNLARLETEIQLSRLLDQFPSIDILKVDYGDNWVVWGPRQLTIKA